MKRMMMMAALGVAALEVVPTARAAHAHGAHGGGYGPIGVMGGHVHSAGEWMFSYRYGTMDMLGNRSGTREVSRSSVHSGFMVAPLRMRMAMHGVGVMFAPSDALTFSAMLANKQVSMDHVTRAGARFTTDSAGIGDLNLAALMPWFDSRLGSVHFNAGLSVPTGSIDKRDTTPMGSDQMLPYPMQLGSGTADFLPGLTLSGGHGPWGWGLQPKATLRLGRNRRGYRLGHRFDASAWLSRSVSGIVDLSARFQGSAWGNVSGADSALNAAMVPTARPDLRAGERIEAGLGVAFSGRSGAWKGHRLAVEGLLPVHQRLNGPQLQTDWRLMTGWQFAY